MIQNNTSRHEIPNAFDAIGKDYETKTTKLLEENTLLEKETKQLETELQQTEMKLIKEQGERLQEAAKVVKLIMISRKWQLRSHFGIT